MKDITGKKYGKLTAIRQAEAKNRQAQWVFKCECGKEKTINKANVVSGKQITCGCGQVTHNMSNTKLYSVWRGMKERCNNPNKKDYHKYGGRGIKVCKRWERFESFYEDMKSTYKQGLTLDRLDTNKGYSKDNCAWKTVKEQALNTRRSRRYCVFGIWYDDIKVAAGIYKVASSTIRYWCMGDWRHGDKRKPRKWCGNEYKYA